MKYRILYNRHLNKYKFQTKGWFFWTDWGDERVRAGEFSYIKPKLYDSLEEAHKAGREHCDRHNNPVGKWHVVE